ncbi:MAG: FkbM family methyltransferase [Nitrospinota bacterium]
MKYANCNSKLYEAVIKRGFNLQYVVEVGVWHPESSNIYRFIEDGLKTALVEPDPKSIELIKAKWGDYKNVRLYEVAIADFEGEIQLCQKGSSTFASSLTNSPALANDNCNIQELEKFMARSVKFSSIDDGNIDLISIDTEGSEWFVIKDMVSRPTIISIETHGELYINPYINQLKEWLDNQNYTLWFKDKSDSIYVLKDEIYLTFSDKMHLLFTDILLVTRRARKRAIKNLKKFLRSIRKSKNS